MTPRCKTLAWRREGRITSFSYQSSGVDVDAGAEFVKLIAPLARSTARVGADAALGGFGGFFDLAALGYRDPLLVAATDGVGTKLSVAHAIGRHHTIGIDLVAMCVNDLIVHGAEPIFFLDYLATGTLSLEVGRAIVAGVVEGCRRAGCALIGGETAEMPGFYATGTYDVAGFAVGVVERDRVITGETCRVGDVLLGLASSGVHSNGFSLVRMIVEHEGLAYTDAAPFAPDRALGEALLEPTRLYVDGCRQAVATGKIKGLAHITGGGLIDNIPRVLPPGCAAAIDMTSWSVPKVFAWLKARGGVSADGMARTFNCGIGMVAIVDENDVPAIERCFGDAGEAVIAIGRVVAAEGDQRVVLTGTDRCWSD